jgi:two-component system, LytTR family, sensor histidine kinase AgrC
MDIDMYEFIYLCSSLFGTYTIHKFFGVFFDRNTANKHMELTTFLIYSISIAIIYMFVNIPIVMLFSNMIGFFLLSYNYNASIKIRILAVLFIYLILMCIEMLIVILTGYLKFPVAEQNNYSSVLGILMIKITSYAVVLFIHNFKNLRNGKIVPTTYWICITVIPASSLYIIVNLFSAKELSSTQLILSIIFILFINFTTFHLYDVITQVLSEQMNKKLVEQQNQYYDKQFLLMKESLQTMKEIKHDWKNHLSALVFLIQNGKLESSINHISNLIDVCNNKEGQANTGNIIVDSILNFKLQEASRNNIELKIDIIIPESLNIPSFDLTILIGNLMDNAIEAVLKLEENRYINFKMIYDRGRLLCCVLNPFKDNIKRNKTKIVTTKMDKDNHGIGLESIKNVLKKYDGNLIIEDINYIFSAKLIIYIND